MKRVLKIALDFDETFTEDPDLWQIFVQQAKKNGHEVKFVTFRYESFTNEDIVACAGVLEIDIIYTGMKQKAAFYAADIWIDDMPITIPVHAELSQMADGCERNNDMVEIDEYEIE